MSVHYIKLASFFELYIIYGMTFSESTSVAKLNQSRIPNQIIKIPKMSVFWKKKMGWNKTCQDWGKDQKI